MIFALMIYTHLMIPKDADVIKNNVDPDLSDLGRDLHCLPRCVYPNTLKQLE